ncbi:MAG: hypothetical protein ABIQ32_03135 [Sphingomicrobium sp.]
MDPYGYGSGVSIGYGNGYGSPYGYGYGDPYGAYGYGSPYGGYGYASPYYGWYDDYYYPGTGYYVYGRSGDRYRWSDAQRRYWEQHRRDGVRDNWSGYRSVNDAIGAWANSGNVNGGTTTTQQVRTTRTPRSWDGGMSNNGVTRVQRRDYRSDDGGTVRASRVERSEPSTTTTTSNNGVTRIEHYKRTKDD